MSRLFVLIAAALLGGCAMLGGQEPAPAPAAVQVPAAAAAQAEFARESEEVTALLAYYQRVQNMSAEELRREHQIAGQGFARDKTEFGRLRLVLLMCVPGAPWRDDARVLALLDASPARNAPPESPRRHFVTLLQKLVAERAREQRRADELQQKLDAMLEIERSLRSRRKK
jgi:hypothetical protein